MLKTVNWIEDRPVKSVTYFLQSNGQFLLLTWRYIAMTITEIDLIKKMKYLLLTRAVLLLIMKLACNVVSDLFGGP